MGPVGNERVGRARIKERRDSDRRRAKGRIMHLFPPPCTLLLLFYGPIGLISPYTHKLTIDNLLVLLGSSSYCKDKTFEVRYYIHMINAILEV